jgi:hypothetical protein
MDEELLPIPTDPALMERCKALGLKLPERMAHPDTNTPDDSGTLDGTRPQTLETISVEGNLNHGRNTG